ncbi:MAG: GNAT family N-acetyltransferase [Candidatus Paceibacterota bacterium]
MSESVNPKLEYIAQQNIHIFGSDGIKIAQLKPLNIQSLPILDEISSKLTQWRNQSMRFFFTGFKATSERTMSWLKSSVLQSNSKILYLVYVDEKPVGHFGLANVTKSHAELDNAIRGEKGGHTDLFKSVEFVLLDLAFNYLHVDKVEGKLFSNNLIALLMHKQFGFTVTERSKLKRVEDGDEWHYTPCDEKESNTKFDQLLITLTKAGFIEATKNKQIKWEFDQ